MTETETERSWSPPSSWLVSLLAAVTTWVTMLTWGVFADDGSAFLGPILFGCLLIAVSGMLLRTTRLPALAVAVVQVMLLGAWLHHRWAGDLALFGWLPSRDSIGELVETIGLSVTAARDYPSPVPATVTDFPPVMILAGLGAAVLVDLLACGLQRPPLAGLPLLAVYTAPVSILDGGVSGVNFALAAVSFMFLLAGHEAQRLVSWGRQLTGSSRLFDTQAGEVSTHAVWVSARRIGLTVTGVAMVAPILIPTFSGTWFDGAGNGPGGGNGDRVSISNPMVDLRRDLSRGANVELIDLTTDGPEPAYLRLTVLDTFDGASWHPSARVSPPEQRANGQRLPAPVGLDTEIERDQSSWSMRTYDAFESRWLPVPYPAASVQAPGDWRYDEDTMDFVSFDKDQDAAGLQYDVEAIDVQPTAEQLTNAGPAPASIYVPYTALPDNMPPIVSELARQVTTGTSNRFTMAVQLQRWFRSEFEYSLAPDPGTGVDDLERFLVDGPGGRVGYCEQFAASMALMGRSLGIPSRVAVGFLRPTRLDDNSYVYRSHDLHAWPEMYFEDTGWVRFEPTPGIRAGDVPAYTTTGGAGIDPSPSPSASASAQGPDPSLQREQTQGPTPGGAGSGGGPGSLVQILIALAAVAGVALLGGAPRVARTLVGRRRWAGADSPVALAETSWAELRAEAVDLRLAWDDDITVRSQARDLVRSFGSRGAEDALGRGNQRGQRADPEATAALDRIVQFLERARFARSLGEGGRSAAEAKADVARCAEAMKAGASDRQRKRARWLPMSVLAPTRANRGRPARPGGVGGGTAVDHAV